MPTRTKTTDNYNPLAFLSPLRLIGALMIAVIYHPKNLYPDGMIGYDFFKANGRIFVEMFFLMSGILFYLAYYKRLSNKSLSYGNFAKKRFFRLYPIILCSCLYIVAFNFINYSITGALYIKRTDAEYIRSFFVGDLSCLGGAQSINGPLWYITVLIICYLISCFLIKLTPEKTRKYFFVIPILIGIAFYTMFRFNLLVGKPDRFGRGLIDFFLGFYLAIFLEKFDTFSNKAKMITRIISAAILVAFILFISLSNFNTFEDHDRSIMFGVIFFPALFVLLYDVKPINKFLSKKVFTIMAALSFAIYVWDYPIRFTFHARGYVWGGWFFLIDLLINLAVGIVWLLLDTYGRKFFNTLFKKQKEVKAIA